MFEIVVAIWNNYVFRIRYPKEPILKIKKHIDIMSFGGNYCTHTVF